MQSNEIQSPSLPAVLIGLIPFAGMCFSVPLWDRLYPMILGLPFDLFWLSSWIVLSCGCMVLAHRIEGKRSVKGKR
jgi:hypothetical protein